MINYHVKRARSTSAMRRSDGREGRLVAHERWKRDLSNRANGTIDPWYGCDIFDEMRDYAINFAFPWCECAQLTIPKLRRLTCFITANGGFDVYDVPDATHPEPDLDAGPFLNSASVRAALHAPTSKNWSSSFNYPFGSVYNKSIGNEHGDPSVEPVAFLTELFANASARNVSLIFYSGNDDAQVQHHGTEVVIQNTTWGNPPVQGFARRPATPWFDDAGERAGLVHQERGFAYVLFTGAGHLVPQWKPAQALVFIREFVLGNNATGTLHSDGQTVEGGEDPALAGAFMPGGLEIFYGSGSTAATSTVPSATANAWSAFMETATVAQETLTGTQTATSLASRVSATSSGSIAGSAPTSGTSTSGSVGMRGMSVEGLLAFLPVRCLVACMAFVILAM